MMDELREYITNLLAVVLLVTLVAFAIVGLGYTLNSGKPDPGLMSPLDADPSSQLLYPNSAPETPSDAKFKIGRAMSVVIVTEKETSRFCSQDALACANRLNNTIYVPNPCRYPSDIYAVLLCHEMAHLNGWDHENDGAWVAKNPEEWTLPDGSVVSAKERM